MRNDIRKDTLNDISDLEIQIPVVKESILPTLKMYHGSFAKFNSLKPTAFNAGHKLKKHSWSVFLWPQYDLAYKWALFVSIKNGLKERKEELGFHRPLGEHLKDGFTKYKYRLCVYEDDYEVIRKAVNESNLKMFVYTVNVPMDLKFGIGNTNAQPEFTYDGELPIEKLDIIKITDEIYKENVEAVSLEEYKRLEEFKFDNIRGPIGLLYYDSDDAINKWKFVKNKVKSGEAKIGDDLDKLLKDYDPNKRNW